MSGLSQEDLDKMKTRANNTIKNSRDHDSLTLQLAADILMLLLDKKIKEA